MILFQLNSVINAASSVIQLPPLSDE